MNRLFACFIAVTALAIAAPAPGADKSPNLSGKWTLNKDKSEFARGAPDSLTAAITDDGKKIRMVQTVGGPEGDRTTELNIERDAESVNHMGDMEMRTKLRQDGAKLLEDTTFSGPQGTLTRKSVITLSADGKTLTLDGDYESPSGGFHEKIVLDKVD
ncbi:MAG: hypothetical protein ABSH47_01930 [Bryobacteraceae bacterium]|jgi:hypothetical protein